MGSEAPSTLVKKVNVATLPTGGRSCSGKTKEKVPKRIHKAEKERLKREHLNELFLQLADALELDQQNNGKASILCEATRLLKDLLGQIQSLRKEHESLLSESNYVAIEKNELMEETSTLETQIEKLQSEIGARVAESKPDLNVPPPECLQSDLTLDFNRDCLGLQPGTLLVVPICSDIQAYPIHDPAQEIVSKGNSFIRKPHARYPSPADSWPSQLMHDQSAMRNGIRCSGEQSPNNL